MSKTTKRKHVTKEVMDNYVLPESNQQIVKVTAGRGNNLHEVQAASGETFLASMPTKFRKNVWIKRGDFVIVEPIEEGDKVKAEIIIILYKGQIKYIKKEGCWPEEFLASSCADDITRCVKEVTLSDESDEDDDLFVNTNRAHHNVAYTSESDSDDESSDDDHA